MVNTFVNPVLNPDVNLGMQAFDDEARVRLYPNASVQEMESVIQAIYRQVLGNAYVMESERLTIAESRLRNGELTVREFVRQVALSELYRARFVDPCTRSRTIELNFKHLLGRAPTSYAEIVDQGRIYEAGGYEAEIDSYLDSEEYQSVFGEDIVPYARGHKTEASPGLTGFTHWFSLMRSAASSDKDLAQHNRPRLNRTLMANSASAIQPPQSRARSNQELLIRSALGLSARVSAPSPAIATRADSVTPQPSQTALLQTLRAELADLQRLASIGAAITNANQYNTASSASELGAFSGSAQGPADDIERLREQIAQARALAAIGEARLNRWKGRLYN